MEAQRKRLIGQVVSNKMEKTVVVVVRRTRRHPLYGKVIRLSKRYKAHDEDNACQVGDQVRIVESRPVQQGQALARRGRSCSAPRRSIPAPLKARRPARWRGEAMIQQEIQAQGRR